MREVNGVSGAGLPATFGEYTVLSHLATGGMAEVYLARQSGIEGFEREVVIKRVRPDLMADREFTRSLLAEARIVATLQHPNIAQVYEIGRVDNSYFIVMEYLPGADLRQVLDRAAAVGRTLAIEDAIYIAIQACVALHYAHEKHGADGRPQGLIHRDVTPSNILLSHDGAVKVCDFGIAKATLYRAESAAGTVKGKYGYMSPEQCRSQPLDRRSDVFALGILLYELTTATRPFAAPNDLQVLRSILRGPPRPPSSWVSDYPRELERIVMRALATDPADRYRTAQAMQLELEELARERKLRLSSVNIARLMRTLFADGAQPAAEARPAAGRTIRAIPRPMHTALGSPHPGFEPFGRTWPGFGGGVQPHELAGGVPARAPVRMPPRPTPSPPPVRVPLAPIPIVSCSAPTEVEAPRPRRSGLWLGAAIVAGVATGGVSVADQLLQRSSTSSITVGLDADADRIATAIEGSVRLARARATGIATMPIVRAAIETDAATMRDVAEHESVLAIGAGETLEIFQTRDGETTSLLRVPASAAALAAPTGSAPGIMTAGGALTVVADAAIVPASSTAGVTGRVTIAAPVDLSAATRQLAPHVRAAVLRGPGLEHALVESTGASFGVASTIALPGPSELGAIELVAVAAPVVRVNDWVQPAQLAGAAVGFLCLVGYVLPRRRPRVRPHPIVASLPRPAPAVRVTVPPRAAARSLPQARAAAKDAG